MKKEKKEERVESDGNSEVEQENLDKEEKAKEPSLEEQVEIWKNKYYFALADLKNNSTQHEKDRQSLIKYAFQDSVETLLPILDAFELAFKVKPPSQETENYLKGFEFIYTLLKQALESKGVQIIEPKVGDKYDSKLHYATEVEEVEDEKEVDKIVALLLKGYKLHDRVIRSANVKVSILKKEEKLESEKGEN